MLATVLEPILPSILVWGFEFWLSGFGAPWLSEDRAQAQARAQEARAFELNDQKKKDKATKSEWYDGTALIVELVDDQAAIVHRVPWMEPARLRLRCEAMMLLNPEHSACARGVFLSSA